MKFEFKVGDSEVHDVTYEFDKILTGKVSIKIDGKEIIETHRWVKNPLKNEQEPIKFSVGEKEKHEVTIKVTTPTFLAPFRSSKYEVLVDGKLLNTYNL